MSLILGIDPGFATIGFGFLNKEKDKLTLVDYGIISTEPHQEFPERLSQISQDLSSLLNKYKPSVCAIEKLFFAKNTKTALDVAQARGVILETLNRDKSRLAGQIFEYTPLQVKNALVGYGHADKNQIQQMVKIILKLNHIPSPDDAADAIAIAICHCHTNPLAHLSKNK